MSFPFSKGPLHGSRQAVLGAFAPLGVSGEGVDQYGIVALDVGPNANFRSVKELLRSGAASASWDYEEGCVSDAWVEIDVSHLCGRRAPDEESPGDVAE